MLPRKAAQYTTQEMGWWKFIVPVSRNQQAARALNASAYELQEIECCFVCPVQILQDHDAGCIGWRKPLQEPGEQHLTRNSLLARRVGKQGKTGHHFTYGAKHSRGLES